MRPPSLQLRRNTMTSTWLKMKNKDKAHEHEFRKEDEVWEREGWSTHHTAGHPPNSYHTQKYCEDTDDWVKTCATCGFEVHFDKF